MIKVAVIGVGIMGSNHARVFSELKNVKLSAICDVNKKNAKEVSTRYKTQYYLDHKDLLRQGKVDAVTIAVPTSEHIKIATDFIEKRIPTLVEKPLASNSTEAKTLIEKARKLNTILTVGHIERFNPAVIKLTKLIRRGVFGDILSIIVRRVGLFPTQIKDVGVVTDLAVHDLDIITNLVNKKPKRIFARGGRAFTDNHEDHAEIFLDFGDFGCFILTNWVTPVKIRKLSVTGTKGHAELDYITQKLYMYKSNNRLKKVRGFNQFVTIFGEPRKSEVKIKSEEPLKLELQNFINSIIGTDRLKVKPEEALNALYLSELVNKSIKSRKLIRVA